MTVRTHDPRARIGVRRATPSHAPAIRDIAHAAWRDTYRGRLRDETIEWFLERAYSDERVDLRIERHETWIAEWDGVVAAFAETAIEPDHVTLVAIYAEPAMRGLGLGTALLGAVVEAHPDLPVAADVLTGNRQGEVFYEARGFEPREDVEEQLGDELVSERRWWLGAAGRPDGTVRRRAGPVRPGGAPATGRPPTASPRRPRTRSGSRRRAR